MEQEIKVKVTIPMGHPTSKADGLEAEEVGGVTVVIILMVEGILVMVAVGVLVTAVFSHLI